MTKREMLSAYRMVCEDPDGEGVTVERLPQSIDVDRTLNSQPHTHSYFEIIWFQDGGGIHTVDFEDYDVRRNAIFFLIPGQVHHYDESTPYRGYSIKICSELCYEVSVNHDTLKHDLFCGFQNIPLAYLHDSAAPELERMFQLLEHEQECTKEPHHREMLTILLRMILIYIHRNSRRGANAPAIKHQPAYSLYLRFRALLEEEFMHMHQVAQYADRLGVSTKTLGNAIKATTGQTALAVIDERILLESKRLLRFSNLMVKEVAFQLGFEDSSNFVKFFTHHTGTLPNSMRRSRTSD